MTPYFLLVVTTWIAAHTGGAEATLDATTAYRSFAECSDALATEVQARFEYERVVSVAAHCEGVKR